MLLFEFWVVIFGAFLIPLSVCDCRIAGEVGKCHQCFEKKKKGIQIETYRCLLDLT
jgi:hypothetical protein